MPETTAAPARLTKRSRRRIIWWSVAGVIVLLIACGVWVAVRALQAKAELEASLPLVDKAQSQITSGDSAAAAATTRTLARHLHAARDETSDPIWRAAEIIPGVGANLSAVRQVAWAASDVTDRSIAPLAKLAGTINLASFTPKDGKVDLKPLATAAPAVTRANTALQSDLEVVRSIDTSGTIGPVTDAVNKLSDALGKAGAVTDVASRAARLLPAMLGADGPRNYVLVFQNNAEARSTGGIVGALALLHTEDGKITLVRQASTSDFTQLQSPAVPLNAGTKKLYGNITGEFVQDTTLTPNFATSGQLVSAMWQKRYGTKVDGVISLDPVALSYILKATGPVDVVDGEQLTSDNAVQVLLSESYAKFSDPKQQDAFFAASAAAVFTKVASGQFDTATMLSALTQAGDERRVLLWNAKKSEQAVVADTTLSGPLPTSTGNEHRFGVYLNDATGAKMDYYLHTTVGLGSAKCRSDGRANYLVQVTLASDAPEDAATSLPWYVTGAGLEGVPAGDTYTTVAVYAPKGFVTVGATTGGQNVTIQRATDGGLSVAHVLVKLTPGQTATYDFQFVGAPVVGTASATSTLDAVTTPGVWATDVRRAAFGCSDVLR
ncbi:DUF4012 domain-containing protein [Humibacter sp. RRB41]|uniref:DUF4012 domain-containing protein n=1 Tax=Humibacter sp. RRB41 TaxID=2919946 RepID=UPI001FAAD9ED|nr:DUF4012 domain-containing protein [Humibacter sp. RRB41]